MWRRLALALALGLAAAAPSAAPAAGPSLHFSTFVVTDLALGDVVWTGSEFLYNAEWDDPILASDAKGRNLRTWASFPHGGEEMRCVANPAAPKYWPAGIYCHTSDNRIMRLDRDGSNLTELARLPVPSGETSDGSIAFDTTGSFGYALIAASGGSSSNGGQVFAIRKTGKVTPIGTYSGPGGADHIAMAPASFGAASGTVLLAIDEDATTGRLLAMDRRGNVKTLASGLNPGLNPIAVIEASPANRAASLPAAGLYVADTSTKSVYFTAASALKSYVGAVIVGTEQTAKFWIVRPKGSGAFETIPVTTDMPARLWNLEAAAYVR